MSDYVYDLQAAPNRQVTLPKTVPLPSLKNHRAQQDAAETQATPAPKKEAYDLVPPVPAEAQDPDLLRLMERLGEGAEEVFEQSGELVCQVAKDRILEALKLCLENPSLHYEMLSDETATHFPAAKDFAFSVVYHLTSFSRAKRLRLRILIPEGFEPESATQVYPAANWLEREIFDMLGIRFQNHPDLVRILCPDDWEDHPLRKEYPVTGWGQRDIDFRDDRSGMLERKALEKAGNVGINLKVPKAE